MTYSEYETAVLQSLNECEQFKHWSFDDLKDSIYNEFEYGDNLKQFYEYGCIHFINDSFNCCNT